MKILAQYALTILLSSTTVGLATSQTDAPKPIPKNRAEIKQNLDALKTRTPRLPFESDTSDPSTVNNARARRYFLPQEWFAGEPRMGGPSGRPGSSAPNPASQASTQALPELVDYELKTKCFWVVSRGNNCHYCLGHQEHKLSIVGLTDDQIAALDQDWDSLDSPTRKAVTLARKMTLQPHQITDADIEGLRPEFDDAQIVELVYTIARFNSTNRWTDAMGIPQDSIMRDHEINFLTETSPKFSGDKSLASPDIAATRDLPTDDDVKEKIASALNRKARVKLASDDETRKKLELSADQRLNDWHRAMAALIAANPSMVKNLDVMLMHEELSPVLKARLMQRSARLNQSWLAAKLAEQRYEQIADRIGSKQSVNEVAESTAIEFTDKLTARPYAISDADVAGLQKHFTDRQVAQIIHVVATANGIDRFCETLGLSTK
jgi:alkylhydroperoxidase family enzyme